MFDASILDRTVIALPLVKEFEQHETDRKNAAARGEVAAEHLHPIVVDLNMDYRLGRDAARRQVIDDIVHVVTGDAGDAAARDAYRARLDRLSPLQYVAATLSAGQVLAVVRRDVARANHDWSHRCIYRVWPDFQVSACLTKSAATIKADAARTAFKANGRGVVWAVLDSGIDGKHPHFATHRNLELKAPVRHESFLDDEASDPLVDDYGHGTHVAGIIGGTLAEAPGRKSVVYAAHGVREEEGDVRKIDLRPVQGVSGIAPECSLVSLKVLDAQGNGTTTAIIRALQRVNEINQDGRRLLIHGVNLSLGYEFDPEWFACGQSPLCVEVDRLVRSGVVVVVAAGNSGYGTLRPTMSDVKSAGLALTINDPGNAESAITVGSTHREMPHIYGASYFSSKGPTGDGRIKPDLLAPGEKILSCAAGARKLEMLQLTRSASSPARVRPSAVQYVEDSGTSMAAPHVSGAIAAFLSVRREFQGQAERVKQLFLDNATDLRRDRYFQGRGLLDLMRTIQSV